jgi:hypothetical protein
MPDPRHRLARSLLAALSLALGLPAPAGAVGLRFADTVVAFAQGPNEDPSLGAFPSLSDPDAGLGASDGALVTLGSNGTLTLSFADPLQNLPGADLRVWENPLVLPEFGGNYIDTGFIEVSSNGTDFARFPTLSLVSDPVGQFDLVDPALYSGFAGLRPFDDFDLAVLAGLPAVVSGAVDLAAIRYVRIVDVRGDGSVLDTAGNAVFDTFPGAGNAGFDLDAIAAIPEPTSGTLLAAGLVLLAGARRRRRG